MLKVVAGCEIIQRHARTDVIVFRCLDYAFKAATAPADVPRRNLTRHTASSERRPFSLISRACKECSLLISEVRTAHPSPRYCNVVQTRGRTVHF